jgi:hypothetical protein
VKKSLGQYMDSYDNAANDPLMKAINELMHVSKEHGHSSEFYFMGAREGKYNTGYDVMEAAVQASMRMITENKMIVGFHGGYDTYNNVELLQMEKKRVEKALDGQVNIGRQHYLRFDITATYDVYRQAGMKYDSSLGYAEREGFRCGTCYEFHPWDFVNDCEIDLIERPLIVMDGTLSGYRGLSTEAAYDSIVRINSRCKAVGGNLIILWHNTSLDREWADYYHEVYLRFLKNYS